MDKRYGFDYKTILEHIPGGAQLRQNDEDFTIEEVNQEFLEMVGFTREEISGRFCNRFSEMIHPDDREKIREEIAEQLATGNKATLQYRVICKDETYKWVMESGRLACTGDGRKRIFCVLLDITGPVNKREKMRMSLERYQIVMDQAKDIIFEWNIVEDTVICSANWEKKFGYTPLRSGLSHQPMLLRHIHPEDVPALLELMENMKAGAAYAAAESRFQNGNGDYFWCRVRTTNQYDAAGKPVKVVGIITDIDEEKRMIDDLRKRAEKDALTGLYNREETERQIRGHLENAPNERCALYIIDTDNFKLINDGQGHLFGDAGLSELAAGMKKITRRNDVAGRIGGDEFMILVKDIPSREAAEDKAKKLVDMFRNLFLDEKQAVAVTCSIGAAIYPDDGETFQSLYRSADLALYEAKSRGKNRYVFFESDKTLAAGMAGYSSLGSAIDSDQRNSGVPGDLVSYVFQILYDTGDIRNAIQLILEIVGKRFDVSRAYIFENSEDGKYTSNTYEWCNEGIVPQKENLQNFPYEGMDDYEALFKDDSVFYCRDIHALKPEQVALFESQGICSTLQCAIREDEKFHGFVGFDECTGTRLWTKEEIGMLSLVSQLLVTFLQKNRIAERDYQLAVRLNTILDVQDAYIYAIDRESYQLLYINHKTKELDPEAELGMTCHSAFFGKDTPCENCPLSGGAGEIYNPRYGVWTRVRVASMKWGDNDAYLLTCFDITEYKKM